MIQEKISRKSFASWRILAPGCHISQKANALKTSTKPGKSFKAWTAEAEQSCDPIPPRSSKQRRCLRPPSEKAATPPAARPRTASFKGAATTAVSPCFTKTICHTICKQYQSNEPQTPRMNIARCPTHEISHLESMVSICTNGAAADASQKVCGVVEKAWKLCVSC